MASKNIFEIKGAVTRDLVLECKKWLERCTPSPGNPIVIVIDTLGGLTYPAFHLIRCIRNKTGAVPFITIARQACSAGALLFLAGNIRKIIPSGEIMIHCPDWTVPITALDENGAIPAKDFEVAKLLKDSAIKLLKKTKLTDSEIWEIMKPNGGKTFTTEQALNAGIATEIADELHGENNNMDQNAAREIFESIKTAETELKQDLIRCALRYARLRTDWRLANPDERRLMETARTAAHNALIDSANILSRAMVKIGEDATWRRKLGDDRKEIGDWACYVHAHLGIEAR